MRSQRIPLVLSHDEYKRLEAIAIAHERDPWQHARWIIRQAIQAEERPDKRPSVKQDEPRQAVCL